MHLIERKFAANVCVLGEREQVCVSVYVYVSVFLSSIKFSMRWHNDDDGDDDDDDDGIECCSVEFYYDAFIMANF